MARLIGVLGGMGPLATVDFFNKIVNLTPANNDQEHVPVILYSVPQIPDRTEAILGTGDSPLPAMLNGLRTLEKAGVDAIAVPCNTAHNWLNDLRNESAGNVHFIHIIDETIKVLESDTERGAGVGLLATVGTLTCGIYKKALKLSGFNYIVPDDKAQTELVKAGINAVKAGDITTGAELLNKAAIELKARGAKKIIMGCTEIPIALADAAELRDILLDPTLILAKACVAYSRSEG